MRGATWFDETRPPQAVVWLLGAETHDERHKGRGDAYDILRRLDDAGVLFPQAIDYERLELDRRLADTYRFAEFSRRDARGLFADALEHGQGAAFVAGVPCRLVLDESESGLVLVHGAVSAEPVTGPMSGLEFPLTNDRFLLLAESIRGAAEDAFGPEVVVEEQHDFPGGLRNERAFVILFERQPTGGRPTA